MSRRVLAVAALAASLLAACSGLPDLKRGQRELDRGDTEAAERDLKPLAEAGYQDAQLQLARAYATSGDPAAQKKAIALFRDLMEKDPTVAVPLAKLLIRQGNDPALDQAQDALQQADADGDPRALAPLLILLTDYPERDRERLAPKLAKRALAAGTPEAQDAGLRWYRANAGDEDNLKILVKRCAKVKDQVPECYVDLARYYRTVKDGPSAQQLAEQAVARAGTLPQSVVERVGTSLVSEEYPGEALPQPAYKLLRQAAANSDDAKVRMARLLVDYPGLDPGANPEAILKKAVATGNPEAALALGRMYFLGATVPVDPQRSEKYLKMAEALPAAHYYLGRMYKRGDLGYADPVKAAHHLLIAARGGYRNADHHLALLFVENKGARPNLASAYVFATIAVENGNAEAPALLAQIKSQLNGAQLQQAQKTLRQEATLRTELALRQATADALALGRPPATADAARMETSP